jgi:hypothetical protein
MTMSYTEADRGHPEKPDVSLRRGQSLACEGGLGLQ